MILNDFVVMGRARPQNLQDGREVICTAGYSDSFGLCRIYPTPAFSEKFRQWNILECNVRWGRHSRHDWRAESWHLENSKDLSMIEDGCRIITKKEREDAIKLLDGIELTCPKILNKKRKSIGIVSPIIKKFYIKNSIPQIEYSCNQVEGCTGHKQQLLEYGAWVWCKNNPTEMEKVFDNLRLMDTDYQKWFLVGNGIYHPSSFMIISVLRFKRIPLTYPVNTK